MHTMEYYSEINRNTLLISETTVMNLKTIMLKKKKPDIKEYLLYNFLYIKVYVKQI